MTLCAQGVPMKEVYLFDWGDTLMVDFPGMAGKMCDWTVVETVEGAREVLAVLSQKARIYVATGAADSTESEIKRAFERVGLSQRLPLALSQYGSQNLAQDMCLRIP